MSRFCAKCGMELKDNTIFCPGCGAKVGAKEQRTVKETREGFSNRNSMFRNSCFIFNILGNWKNIWFGM